MKKLLLIIALLLVTAVAASAQTTPNYNFQVPPFNSPNWNTIMNQNWYSLDSILLGISAGSPGGLVCSPLSSFSPPPTGVATIVCMSDAQPTNPCTAGGSGSLAIGLNGVYNCAGGTGGSTGLGDPSANGIVFRSGLNITRPATFADWSPLLSGAPDASVYARGDGAWAAPPGSGVTSSGTSPGPVAGYFGATPSTQVQPDVSCLTDFSGHLNCLGMSAGVLSATGSGANGPLIANEGTTGTTSGSLAKIVGGFAVLTATGDTAIPMYVVMPTVTNGSTGICAGGTTGNACLATSGQTACLVDAGGGTANHFVINSSTVAGACKDGGATLPPGPVCVVGTFAETIAANGTGLVNAAPACYGSGTGVADPGANGYMVRTSSNVSVARTFSAGTGLTVSNGDGTAGNTQYAVDGTVATASSTNTFTNKTLNVESTGNVVTRTFYVEFTGGCNGTTSDKGAFDLPTTGAATFTCFGTTTTQGMATFPISVTTTATGHFTLPQGWTGAMDARISWFAPLSSANSVFWSMQSGCVGDGDAMSTGPSYNTASTGGSAYTGTANQRKTATFTNISMTNCAAGETMYFIWKRLGGNAGDTLGATAYASIQFEGRMTK
jgi:hypothetical protein